MDIFHKILDSKSFTIINYLIEDELKIQETPILRQMYNLKTLDEIYAICHRQLGNIEKAEVIEDFISAKKQNPSTC